MLNPSGQNARIHVPGPPVFDGAAPDPFAAAPQVLVGDEARAFAERLAPFATLTPGLRYVWNVTANAAGQKASRNAFLGLGAQGVGPNDYLRGLDDGAPSSPALTDLYDRYQRQIEGRPAASPEPPLKGPSTLQLAAGGLFALLAPRYAALALAAPFQAGLREHEIERERTQVADEEAYRRWRDDLEATQAQIGALVHRSAEEEPPLAPPGGAPRTVPTRTAPSNAPPALAPPERDGVDLRLERLWADGKHAEANAMSGALRDALRQGRRHWVGPNQAGRIAGLEDGAERARQRAYDTASGTKVRASASALAALRTRLRDAIAQTDLELRSLRTQEAALRAPGAPARPDDLQRLRILRKAREVDLRRLAELDRETEARLENAP